MMRQTQRKNTSTAFLIGEWNKQDINEEKKQCPTLHNAGHPQQFKIYSYEYANNACKREHSLHIFS